MFKSEVASALTQIFSLVKQLYDIDWPGTNLSIFGIFTGVLVTVFVISIARRITQK